MIGENILVVDDEQSMTEFISILLGKDGYRVITANSGQEAIEKAQDMKRRRASSPTSRCRGSTASRCCRGSRSIDPSMPVIIMTAYASQQSAIDAVNLGAFQYLEKSAKNDEIKARRSRTPRRCARVQSENQFLKRELKRSHEEKADHRHVRGDDARVQDGGQGRGQPTPRS